MRDCRQFSIVSAPCHNCSRQSNGVWNLKSQSLENLENKTSYGRTHLRFSIYLAQCKCQLNPEKCLLRWAQIQLHILLRNQEGIASGPQASYGFKEESCFMTSFMIDKLRRLIFDLRSFSTFGMFERSSFVNFRHWLSIQLFWSLWICGRVFFVL